MVDLIEPDDEKQKKEKTTNSKKMVKLLEVDLTNVLYISTLRVRVGKNYKKEQARSALGHTEIFRRFEKNKLEHGVPLLHPIDDMKVPDPEGTLASSLKAKETDSKLMHDNVMHDRDDRDELVRKCVTKSSE